MKMIGQCATTALTNNGTYEETTIIYLKEGTSVMTNPDYILDECDRAGLKAFEDYCKRRIIREIMNGYKESRNNGKRKKF